jgi:hypothetical protein
MSKVDGQKFKFSAGHKIIVKKKDCKKILMQMKDSERGQTLSLKRDSSFNQPLEK